MKNRHAVLLLAAILALPLLALAQAKQEAAEGGKKPGTVYFGPELRIHVLLNEYDGEKKVGSFPYTLTVEEDFPNPTKLRMGIRVPVATGNNQYQYMDVGTNIDCRAKTLADGRYRLTLSVERTSVYSVDEKKGAELPGNTTPIGAQPIVRNFRVEFNSLLRDGQTVQTTSAADPVSGRVLKVDVTVNVVK